MTSTASRPDPASSVQPLRQRGERCRGALGEEHGQRVRVEGHRDRGRAARRGLLDQLPEDRPVTAVHPVEVAEGDDGTAEVGGDLREAVPDVHGGHSRRRPVRPDPRVGRVPEYLVLLAPSSNRVYAGDAPAITAAEAEIVVSAAAPDGFAPRRPTTVAGVPYLAVDLADGVDPQVLGRLAATFAVFERRGATCSARRGAGRRALGRRPAHHPQVPRQDQRAADPGPAQHHARVDRPRPTTTRPTVLDPLAGRGTTLSWALTLGYDAVGVEVERREVEAYAAFLTTWLRRKRLKHRIGLTPLRRAGQRLGDVLEAEVGRDDRQSLRPLRGRHPRDRGPAAAPAGRRRGHRRPLRRRPRQPRRAGRPRPQSGRAARGGPPGVGLGAAPGRGGRHRVEHPRAGPRRPRGAVRGRRPRGLRRRRRTARFAHRVDAGIHRDLLVARKPR